MTSNHLVKNAVLLSIAAQRDLNACLDRYQAALIRGDKTAATKFAAEAHDHLDAILDHQAAAAGLTRAIVGL